MRTTCALLLLLLVSVAAATETIRERRERIRNGDDTLPDELRMEDLLPCTLVDDCPQRNCKETRCQDSLCVYVDYECPQDTANQCTISLGCDEETNTCRYDVLHCDDLNDCTEDACVREGAESPYCVHKETSDCSTHNTHDVQFRVENARHLDVKVLGDDDGVRFCHTSTFGDSSSTSAVLLGFSPYNNCELATRGTCDNRMSSYNRPETTKIRADAPEPLSWLERVSSTLYWADQSAITIVDGGLNVHIFGFMQDSVNEGFKLRVDALFTQTGFFIKGVIMATPGTQYDGLVFSIESAVLDRNPDDFSMRFSAHLVSQAHDAGLVIVDVSDCTGELRGLTFVVKAKTVDYCELLDSDNVQRPLWSEVYDEELSTMTYCTQMSLEELLRCRAYDDKYGSLFDVRTREEDGITIVQGALYHSILEKPVASTALMQSSSTQSRMRCNDACATKQTTSTVYNVTMMANNTHVMHAYIQHVDFDLELRWLGNEWLCCTEEDAGDLRVHFETSIGGENRRLVNARVIAADEVGVPMRFSESENAEQRWSLRTVGEGKRVDFSGVKRLIWDVSEGGSVIGHVVAVMTVNARHVGSQEHALDGKIDAEVSLYTDRFFTQPYIDRTLDGTQVYASVCLNTHRHLDVLIDQVNICYSDATIKSCADVGAKSVLLYSRSVQDEILTAHDFEFVRNPPSTSHCEGFTFLTRGYTKTNQLLQVSWTTQENGGSGGVISMYADDDDHDYHWSHSDSHEFHSSCPHSWTYDWDAGHCRDWNGGNEALFWVFLVFFIILIALFSCHYCNSWSFRNEQYIVDNPPPMRLEYETPKSERIFEKKKKTVRFTQTEPKQRRKQTPVVNSVGFAYV